MLALFLHKCCLKAGYMTFGSGHWYQLSMHMDHPYQPLDVCMSVNVPPLEPIGSAKPKLSQESDILRFKKNVEEPLALLCPAQGSPLPAFRLVVLQSCQFF